jgi:hypothetical protein
MFAAICSAADAIGGISFMKAPRQSVSRIARRLENMGKM